MSQIHQRSNHQWSNLAWTEIDKLERDRTIFLLPTGAIEQHGAHLPVDTDIFNSSALVEALVKNWNPNFQANNYEVIALPPIWWGTSPHHKGYPGTISLRLETFHHLLTDIISSISKHGFYRFLIINGHGGNAGILTASTGDLSESLGVSIPTLSYWQSIKKILIEIGESEIGGMGHACEMETSLALYLRPELVNLDALRKDLPNARLPHSCIDFRQPGFLSMPLDFRRDSREGVMGDPTLATKEKGQRIFEGALLATNELIGSILEMDRSALITDRFEY
ncbi:MAG: creatininase family protein [Actinomycetota bacterium]|nr:creatininase family protein [Actinomycetota bacterium]